MAINYKKLFEVLINSLGSNSYDIPNINIEDFNKETNTESNTESVNDNIDIKALIKELFDKNGILFIAMTIFKLSQEYVPVDTGALRDSGRIEELDDGNYRIVYERPYAAYQHEETDLTHTAPAQAKYLEDAAYEVYNLFHDNNDFPLFTFKFEVLDGGNIALEINTENILDFIETRGKREMLRQLTREEFYDSGDFQL